MNITPEEYHFTLDEGETAVAHDIREAWALFDKYRKRIVSASSEPFKTVLDTQRPMNEQDGYEREKRKIQRKILPPAEYERRIRELTRKLKI